MPRGRSRAERLPQELVNTIVDEYVAGGPANLSPLAFVSPAFNARVREHQFRTVELQGHRGARKYVGDFANILDNNPSVASQVRELSVRDWMVTDPSFHHTIKKLADQRELRKFQWGAEYHWNSLPAGLCESLFQIFSAPYLNVLNLWGLTAVPKQCFVSLRNLTELKLQRVHIQRDQSRTSVGAPALRCLTLLDVDGESCQALFEALLPPRPGYFEHLVDLIIDMGPTTPNDGMAVSNFVRASCRTLQGFTWANELRGFTSKIASTSSWRYHFTDEFSIVHPNFDNPQISLPVLEELDYLVTLGHVDSKPFDGLLSIMRAAGPRNRIQSMVVIIECIDFEKATYTIQYHQPDWSNFVGFVKSCRYLRTITLRVFVKDPRMLEEIEDRVHPQDVEPRVRDSMLKFAINHLTQELKSLPNCTYTMDAEIDGVVHGLKEGH
ncbi:hypothetical protein H0H92_010391 [Tricholoma furcatifolium]|nr:hypothetical protein H0H92_010391 [Tricholoma furcatifolium]